MADRYSTWRQPGSPQVGDVCVVTRETPSTKLAWVLLGPGEYLTRVVATRDGGQPWVVDAPGVYDVRNRTRDQVRVAKVRHPTADECRLLENMGPHGLIRWTWVTSAGGASWAPRAGDIVTGEPRWGYGVSSHQLQVGPLVVRPDSGCWAGRLYVDQGDSRCEVLRVRHATPEELAEYHLTRAMSGGLG